MPEHQFIYWLAHSCKDIRDQSGAVIADIAREAGKDQSSVFRFEVGQTSWPRDIDVYIAAYAKVCNVSAPQEIWGIALAKWSAHDNFDVGARVFGADYESWEAGFAANHREIMAALQRIETHNDGATDRIDRELLDVLFDYAPIGVTLYDHDGIVQRVSDFGAWGSQARDIVGMTVEERWSEHPEIAEWVRTVLATGQPMENLVVNFEDVHGEKTCVEGAYLPVIRGDKVRGVVAVYKTVEES